MTIVTDTNVLLRIQQPDHPRYPVALAALDALEGAGHELAVGQQMYTEFWRVCTSKPNGGPKSCGCPQGENGFGFEPAEAERRLYRVDAAFILLPDPVRQHVVWRGMLVDPGVRGRNVYNARIAAFTLAQGLTHLLTFNIKDFRRYEPHGLVLVAPDDPKTWPRDPRRIRRPAVRFDKITRRYLAPGPIAAPRRGTPAAGRKRRRRAARPPRLTRGWSVVDCA